MTIQEKIAELENRVMILERFLKSLTIFDTNINLDGRQKPVSLLIVERGPAQPKPFTIIPHG